MVAETRLVVSEEELLRLDRCLVDKSLSLSPAFGPTVTVFLRRQSLLLDDDDDMVVVEVVDRH